MGMVLHSAVNPKTMEEANDGRMTKLVDCLNRSVAEIVNKWIPSVGWMAELMEFLSTSDDGIGGCPQPSRSDKLFFDSIRYRYDMSHSQMLGKFEYTLPAKF